MIVGTKDATNTIPFYTELFNGSVVEGNFYDFTFVDMHNKKSYIISLECVKQGGYVLKFTGDFSILPNKTNDFAMHFEGAPLNELYRQI